MPLPALRGRIPFFGLPRDGPEMRQLRVRFYLRAERRRPAFFVIFAISPLIVLLAFITDALFHPAPWMHLVLWIPTIIILSLVLLRPFKGVLVALQYHRQAGESSMQKGPMMRRYEIVEEGSSWTVGTGGQSLKGYPTSAAAIDAAIKAAQSAEKAGERIAIHLWYQGRESGLSYA